MSEVNGGRKETAASTAAPPLIRQAHGGALRAGGVPGNKGGRRPGSKVREACRRGFEKGVPLVRQIVAGTVAGATVADRLRAWDLLGKYGQEPPSQQVPVTEVRDRVAKTLDTIRRLCPPELAQALVDELRGVWSSSHRSGPGAGRPP